MLSTMTLSKFQLQLPKPTILETSLHFLTSLSFPRCRHHHHINLHQRLRTAVPRPFPCTSYTPDNLTVEDGADEERELRDGISEIIEESGVSKFESMEIASRSPKYAEMVRDGVRDLDELSLWNSWMSEKNEEKDEKEEMTSLSLTFKDKVKHIAREKGDNGKIPYLESVGLSLSSSIHLARLLDSEPLPSLIHKVKYVKEIFFSGSNDIELVGKLARRMMLHLSISVDDDVQQTLSFLEKVEARRGGLDMLGSSDASFRHLIESFPRLLLLSVESNMKPVIKYLENMGVPRERIGNLLLLFPSILFLRINDIRTRMRPFQKVGPLDKDVSKILVKYPWVLSQSIYENYEEILVFFDAEEVPSCDTDIAIRDSPILLGSSTDKLKPMVKQLHDLGIRTTRLGKVITTSSQLLLYRPKDLQKVVSFLRDLRLDKESVVEILVRCPEICSASTEKTLQRKVDFLTDLGISEHQLPRVIKKYPELFVSEVEATVMPRLRYLMEHGLSERDITSMIVRFSPLLGYSIENVLRPKLAFLLNIMGKPVKDVVKYPRYFSYSLHKKIKPRYFAVRSRNIECSLADMLAKNDDEFATQYLGIESDFIPSSR